MSFLETLQAFIASNGGGCLIWVRRRKNGYAVMKGRYVHRAIYIALHGHPGEDTHVHHTCGNPSCINPAHLKAETRSQHGLIHHPHQQTCSRGHDDWKPSGLTKNGRQKRTCHTCRTMRRKGLV